MGGSLKGERKPEDPWRKRGGLGDQCMRCDRVAEQERQYVMSWLFRRLKWELMWRVPATRRRRYVRLEDGTRIEAVYSSACLGILLNGGASDWDAWLAVRQHVRPGMIVIDAGAHVGEYTVRFSKAVGAAGSVHAFEPDPRVYPVLTRNVAKCSLGNVVANNLAIGGTEGVQGFVLGKDPTGSGLGRSEGTVATGKLDVRVTTIDAYVRSQKIARVDLVKLDIEGAEVEALNGARRVLEEMRPKCIFVECHGSYDEVVDILKDCRYVPVSPPSYRRYTHVLAVPEERAYD